MKITQDGNTTIIKLNKDEMESLQNDLLGDEAIEMSVIGQEIVQRNEFFGKRESDKPAAGKTRSHKPGKKK